MITLYQMPVSHYCEKARWALVHKRVPHKLKTLLPGLHIKPMLKLSGQSSVPVLKDGKNIVHNSADIFNYLDNEYPRFPLTPEDELLKREALEWEAFADNEIGFAVRIIVYSELLERPDLLIPMFGQDGPWYKTFVLNKAFPKIRSALYKKLPVNDESLHAAKIQLRNAIDRLLPVVGEDTLLVGNVFSRADIAVASLLAPLFQPSQYGLYWPGSIPIGLQNIIEEFVDIKPWVMHVYGKYR